MGLFDLFKPKWKHSDAEIRAEAVRALDAEDGQALAEVARRDPEERIRRIAVKKLSDPALLGEVAERDADEGLRRLAGERVEALWLDRALGEDEAAAREALGQLHGARARAEVVKRAKLPALRRAALDGIDDGKALAEAARHAAETELRRAAVERIDDPSVLRDVALRESSREVALAAVERIADRKELETVVRKAKGKALRKAAKARLEALGPDPAAVKKKDSEDPAAGERLRAKQEAAEAKRAQAESARRAAQEKAAVEAAQHSAEAEERAKARAAEEAELAQARAVEDEAKRAERELAEAARRAQREERERARAEKEARRAAKEAERAAKEEARRAEREAEHERLTALCDSLEALGTAEPPAELPRLEAALKEAQAAFASARADEALRERYQAARTPLAARAAELRDAESWKRWANVPRLEQLCVQVEALLADESLDPKEGRKALKELQAAWKAAGPVPREKSQQLWQRFKAAGDQVHQRGQAQAGAAEGDQAANLALRLELCVRVEALAESTDWKETAEQIKALQAEWKTIGPAPRKEGEEAWKRFRAACDAFFARRKEGFGQRDAERGANLAKQEALCARVEALVDSQDWNGTSDALKQAQAEWKAIGPGPRKQSDEVWTRFRAACDRFFERKKAHFGALDAERAGNLAKKLALCVKVEALAEAATEKDPEARVRALMVEWKELGPAPRDEADAVWGRFRAACDRLKSGVLAAPEDVAAVKAEAAGFDNRLPLGEIAARLREVRWTDDDGSGS